MRRQAAKGSSAEPPTLRPGVPLPPSPTIPPAVAQAILQQLERPLLCSTAAAVDGSDGGGEEDGVLAPDAALLMDRYGPWGLDFVVDTGPRVAQGSTVIDCAGAEPVVVRQGSGDASWLE